MPTTPCGGVASARASSSQPPPASPRVALSCLFVLAADPGVRALHAAVGTSGAGMARWCADDVAALLRGLSQVPRVAPAIRVAEQAARLRLKASRCVLVPMLPHLTSDVAARCKAALRAVDPAWEEFVVGDTGKCLGVWLGPGAHTQICETPLKKYSERVAAQVARAPPAGVLPQWYASHVMSLFSYAAALAAPPPGLLQLQRHSIARLLRLPGTPWPYGGHHELVADWGWPRLPRLDVALQVEMAFVARDPRRVWEPLVQLLCAVREDLPLVQWARGGRQLRWAAAPAALIHQAGRSRALWRRRCARRRA